MAHTPASQQVQSAAPKGSTATQMDGELGAFVEEAIAEIRQVPPGVIHRASAFKWSARAIASYRICASASDQEGRLRFLYLGEHYREAALAHAAMGEQWQPLYAEIDRAMSEDRRAAFDIMKKAAPGVPVRPQAKRRSK